MMQVPRVCERVMLPSLDPLRPWRCLDEPMGLDDDGRTVCEFCHGRALTHKMIFKVPLLRPQL